MNPTVPTQARQIADLETVLRELIEEHRKLLKHVEAQQTAMKTLDLQAMDDATRLQEASRLRIIAMDNKRRGLVMQIGKMLRIVGEPKVGQLAEHFPLRKQVLLKLRADLRGLLEQLANRNHIAGRVAGAVLGHLNTAMRLLAGAVENAGLYTRRGVPQTVMRIGLMEAVG
jgi:hypothetical protein